MVSPACSGTVTRPPRLGCLSWACDPFWATTTQPSLPSARASSRPVIRGSGGMEPHTAASGPGGQDHAVHAFSQPTEHVPGVLAGGARTHDRRIMSPRDCRSCRSGSDLTCAHEPSRHPADPGELQPELQPSIPGRQGAMPATSAPRITGRRSRPETPQCLSRRPPGRAGVPLLEEYLGIAAGRARASARRGPRWSRPAPRGFPAWLRTSGIRSGVLHS